MHSSFGRYARKSSSALICAAAFVAAGCHNNLTSGFGIAWTTMTAEPGQFTTYIVTIDSITLTGKNVGQITALATPEIVDFTQLNNVAELYASASIPNDTYTSATITLDYTPPASGGSSVIGVMVNGAPQRATVTDAAGTSVTTMQVTVNFDPDHPLVITPTYASTSAVRLAVDFNLAASNYVNTATNPATVVVRPFLTIATAPADTKLIRIRGPLINSSVGVVATGSPAGDVGSYTVYERPFYDEVDSLGQLTLFNTADTKYTIDGVSYVGLSGITQMQQLSAGTTMTVAYATFTPSLNKLPTPPAASGTFYPLYVLAGSTVEDIYTAGVSGYVIARNGNTLTLRNWISFLNDDELFANQVAPTAPATSADAQVLVGPNTIVTVDGSGGNALHADAISVGQYISARGLFSENGTVYYAVPASGILTLDATGVSANTGSVRILPTQLFGSYVSSATGSLVMTVENINGWPASVYNFAGNGASATPSAAAFAVNTGSLAVPSVAAGAPLWVNGIMTPFGSAPPDFNATAVNSEASVQVAGGAGTTPAPGNSTAPGTQSCGVGSQVCVPASLEVRWSNTPGTTTPFVGFSDAGLFTLDLTNAQLISAVIRIGPQSITLNSSSASPTISPVDPTTMPVTASFAPQYTVGNPTTSTLTGTATTAPTTALSVYSSFASFVAEVNSTMTSASPAVQFQATGVYNSTANTFTATSMNLVL